MLFMGSRDYVAPPTSSHIDEFLSFLHERGGAVWSVALNFVEHEIAIAAHANGQVKLSDDGRAFYLPDLIGDEVSEYLADLDRRLEPAAVARLLREHDKNLN